MSIPVRLAILLCLCAFPPARACAAWQNGWWWNPAESGRGLFIELQGDTVFCAGFLYDERGRATWVTAALSPRGDDAYAGDLFTLADGQTLAGPWRPARTSNATAGAIALEFSDPTHGRLTWPGGTVAIERFAFGNAAPGTASAIETGWWWNPGEVGRGFGIEVQGDTLLIGGFLYADDGTPTWYLSVGAWDAAALRYRGRWTEYADGQTLTGAYRPPMLLDSNAGAIELAFANSTAAILTLPDGRLDPQVRFAFVPAIEIDWDAQIRLENQPVSGATDLQSSTTLAASWAAPRTTGVARYQVTLTDLGDNRISSRATNDTRMVFTGLKSGTGYRVDVVVCTPARCLIGQPATATAATPIETWQLQGSGANVAGLRRIVSDGNVKLHVMRYGSDAPPALAGRLQLYYGSNSPNARGLATALTRVAADANDPASYLDFVSRAGSTGLISPPAATPLVREVATGQALPLSAALGGRVRLYFEAAGADGLTRILALDAQDGYGGVDFNSGTATVCATNADYSAGGGCAPMRVVDVARDGGHPRIQNARQFKIAYPTLDDWRWDGAAETFMLFTTDRIDGCANGSPNHVFATWDGQAWVVHSGNDGCPLTLPQTQAAHPLHLGGTRYKIVYGDTSDLTGRINGSMLPFLGRKRVLYADGTRTGTPEHVAFSDLETPAQGRRMRFLWPNGEQLDATEEGYIDDFSLVAPTNDLALQVLYLAITDGSIAPIASAAVLRNP